MQRLAMVGRLSSYLELVGDHWWMLLVGAAMWAVLIVCAYRQIRHPDINPDACPQCEHEAGLNGSLCSDSDNDSGLSGSPCRCDNDYHWNYESSAE